MMANEAKILVVDDKKENLLSLELILSGLNYSLVKAQSGREALKVLMKEQDFALILLDVYMPMLDGFETAELIRQSEKLKHIPIIFITANIFTQDNLFKGYKAGAVDYIFKPVDPVILRAKVGALVELYLKNYELISQGQSLKILNERLKQRTEELEKINKELEKFAYVASHDLQEPLRTITSYIQLLQYKFKDSLDDEANEFMDFVVKASGRMRNIILDLLQYSRINRDNKPFEAVDCNLVLKDVLENLNNSIKDSKSVIISDVLPVIYGDYLQMVQLFQNLIGNALKFKSQEREPRIVITSRETDGGFCLFSIEDNGIGIDQKYAGKIFEIFQRLHPVDEYPGTGIGLAICMKIVERHGGKIWMTSEVRKGSTFYFTAKMNAVDTSVVSKEEILMSR